MILSYAIFLLGLAAAAVLAALLVSALQRDEFAFWPPPPGPSWQETAFWGLFRVYCAALVVVAFVDHLSLDWDHWSRLAVGLPLLGLGSALTLYGYGFLGLDNTYGDRAGLVTDGIYAYSRNPQYLASVAAGLGLALTMNSPLALALAVGLLGLYALFALSEEEWLHAQYGRAYADYVRRVPRFIGVRSFARAYDRLVERTGL